MTLHYGFCNTSLFLDWPAKNHKAIHLLISEKPNFHKNRVFRYNLVFLMKFSPLQRNPVFSKIFLTDWATPRIFRRAEFQRFRSCDFLRKTSSPEKTALFRNANSLGIRNSVLLSVVLFACGRVLLFPGTGHLNFPWKELLLAAEGTRPSNRNISKKKYDFYLPKQ